LALALAFPGAAHPYDLAQLLAMPLERLLQLKISVRGGARGAVLCGAPCALGRGGAAAEGDERAP
jgi:hypothetical protein